ncbi:hypothetical protein E8E15_001671 [Penicillium rubens]|nr:hypothetical protein E8E15_001671 [Penicillium rubens]
MVTNIRHAAVHRIVQDSESFLIMLQAAVAFARCIGDDECTQQLGCLCNSLNTFLAKMNERSHHLQERIRFQIRLSYIKEYKSPHKVTLGHIYEGLEDMDIDKVVEQKEDETPKVRFHRAIAGLLVQPYDYMIRAGTEMGVLSTGEADVYLRIGEDPGTLLYHLSVPKGDVGDFTGWDPHSSVPNRLHLTAVGQSLAFTLQALKLRPRNQAWRQQAINTLPRWKVVVADILESIPDEETHKEIQTTTNLTPIRRAGIRASIATSNGGIHRRPIQHLRQLHKDHQEKTTGATAR